MSHRAEVQVRNIPHVHDAEIDPRGAWHAVHQSFDQLDRRRIIRREDRAKDSRRVNNGKLEAAALAGDEIPRGAFGNGFGLYVGGQVTIQDRPAGFVERLFLRRMTVVDRPARRGQHNTRNVCAPRATPATYLPALEQSGRLRAWGR